VEADDIAPAVADPLAANGVFLFKPATFPVGVVHLL